MLITAAAITPQDRRCRQVLITKVPSHSTAATAVPVTSRAPLRVLPAQRDRPGGQAVSTTLQSPLPSLRCSSPNSASLLPLAAVA